MYHRRNIDFDSLDYTAASGTLVDYAIGCISYTMEALTKVESDVSFASRQLENAFKQSVQNGYEYRSMSVDVG